MIGRFLYTCQQNLMNKQPLITVPSGLRMFYEIVETARAAGDFWIRYERSGPERTGPGVHQRQMFTRSAWPAVLVWSTSLFADTGGQCHGGCPLRSPPVLHRARSPRPSMKHRARRCQSCFLFEWIRDFVLPITRLAMNFELRQLGCGACQKTMIVLTKKKKRTSCPNSSWLCLPRLRLFSQMVLN